MKTALVILCKFNVCVYMCVFVYIDMIYIVIKVKIFCTSDSYEKCSL